MIIFIFLVIFSGVAGNVPDRVTLTSGPPSNYSLCPGDVVFTCNANRLSAVFWWINSNTIPIAKYAHVKEDLEFPVNLTTSASIQLGLVILLTNVVHHHNSENNFTTTACIIIDEIVNNNISKIWCGQSLINTSLSISFIREVKSEVLCFIKGNMGKNGIFELVFELQNASKGFSLMTYTIKVFPSVNCSGDNNSHKCYGLSIHILYQVIFQLFDYRINRILQDKFLLLLQVPPTPLVGYDVGSNYSSMNIFWSYEQENTSLTSRCSYSNEYYIVKVIILADYTYKIHHNVSSTMCYNRTCTISLPYKSGGYLVSVQAVNNVGFSIPGLLAASIGNDTRLLTSGDENLVTTARKKEETNLSCPSCSLTVMSVLISSLIGTFTLAFLMGNTAGILCTLKYTRRSDAKWKLDKNLKTSTSKDLSQDFSKGPLYEEIEVEKHVQLQPNISYDTVNK